MRQGKKIHSLKFGASPQGPLHTVSSVKRTGWRPSFRTCAGFATEHWSSAGLQSRFGSLEKGYDALKYVIPHAITEQIHGWKTY